MNLSIHGEAIEIDRPGAGLFTLSGGIDPKESRLYLDSGADILEGDIATFRGIVRRIIAIPEVWHNPLTGWNAGVVATYEAAPTLMPDLGMLYRPNGSTTFDREANTVVPNFDLVWTGPISVEPASSAGTALADAEQVVNTQFFTVTAPLELIDIRPDDELETYQSRDERLVTRRLVVTAIAASSTSLVRTFSALDNQG